MRALCSGFEEQARIAQVATAAILATSTLLCFSFSVPPVLLYHTPYGSVSAGREKRPFNVLFFLKVEPPCDQT